MAEKNPKPDAFETSLKELEKIVMDLEKGEIPLEDQLKWFERGVTLSRDCMKRLDEIERRIEQLVQSPETGELSSVPFNPAPDSR